MAEVAHLLDVGHAEGALHGGGAGHGRLRLPREVRLELLHPGGGEERRGVAHGHERPGGKLAVIALREEVHEGGANLVGTPRRGRHDVTPMLRAHPVACRAETRAGCLTSPYRALAWAAHTAKDAYERRSRSPRTRARSPSRSPHARPAQGADPRAMSAALAVVVLAGERSEALVSDVPAALHQVAGAPAAQYVIDAARRLDPATVVAVGDEQGRGRDALSGADAFLAGPRELFPLAGRLRGDPVRLGRCAPARPLQHERRREAARGDAPRASPTSAPRAATTWPSARRPAWLLEQDPRGDSFTAWLTARGARRRQPRGHGRGGRAGGPAAREPAGAGAGRGARARAHRHPPPQRGRHLPRPLVRLRRPGRAPGAGRRDRAQLLPPRRHFRGGGRGHRPGGDAAERDHRPGQPRRALRRRGLVRGPGHDRGAVRPRARRRVHRRRLRDPQLRRGEELRRRGTA